MHFCFCLVSSDPTMVLLPLKNYSLYIAEKVLMCFELSIVFNLFSLRCVTEVLKLDC